jgi:N-methylhydantoinase A
VLVNLHTAVIASRRQARLDVVDRKDARPDVPAAEIERRRVWFDEGWLDTPVYRRDWLPAGARFSGPAIVEQLDSTLVVEPGNTVVMDPGGNLIVTL